MSAPTGNDKYWFNGDMGIGMDIKGVPFPDPVKELAEKIAEEELDTPRTMENLQRSFGLGCRFRTG